ncbi:two-component system, OmpR family, sensor histidine kinase VicK [Catalinimonas alkaloidigena]|uniref:histidine kinase n=1 Tax=Catalinimonas alkaloidigena TaxID=1075417 RepID=A0A1G9T8L9_9BACT|nr:PAS domain-containing sensor histidine kinase [Catalinimonas alkaloidigena]SDM43960.1 two-component system, OmpR family, sensor histidine kinase VicK [Catalinimonas alkaloidigena]
MHTSAPQQHLLLSRLAEHTSYLIFAYEVSTRSFLYANPAFERIWQADGAISLKTPDSLLMRVHADDRTFVHEKFEELLQGKSVEELEFRVQPTEGNERWICLIPTLLSGENGPVISAIGEDITKLKLNAEKLRKFAAKKNSVLEILSHDLANPLATIQSLSALLTDRTKALGNEKVDRLVGLIAETSARSIDLIRNFVATEFLESVEVDLLKERVDLLKCLRQVLEQYQHSEKNIGKTFRLEAQQESVFLHLDEVKFMQVINNLLSNAIKFTDDAGIITLRVEEQPDQVLITVADNGIGIPADMQEGLFERFPKARRRGLKGEPSTGLGMSIIHNIVAWHGGTIRFESQENVGTTFYITLPKE